MTTFAVYIQGRVTDPEALDRYRALTPATRDAHLLGPLAICGPHEVLAVDPVDGIAIPSFPTMAAAKAWYASTEYQAVLPHRLQGSTGQVYLVEVTDA